MLETNSGIVTEESIRRNALIDEILNARSRDGDELSATAKEILRGKRSLSELITPETRQFLQARINSGVLQSLVMMGGVFPETEQSIAEAKLDNLDSDDELEIIIVGDGIDSDMLGALNLADKIAKSHITVSAFWITHDKTMPCQLTSVSSFDNLHELLFETVAQPSFSNTTQERSAFSKT